jgi:hypothetical protein
VSGYDQFVGFLGGASGIFMATAPSLGEKYFRSVQGLIHDKIHPISFRQLCPERFLHQVQRIWNAGYAGAGL